jgi:hypothetical protein
MAMKVWLSIPCEIVVTLARYWQLVQEGTDPVTHYSSHHGQSMHPLTCFHCPSLSLPFPLTSVLSPALLAVPRIYVLSPLCRNSTLRAGGPRIQHSARREREKEREREDEEDEKKKEREDEEEDKEREREREREREDEEEEKEGALPNGTRRRLLRIASVLEAQLLPSPRRNAGRRARRELI